MRRRRIRAVLGTVGIPVLLTTSLLADPTSPPAAGAAAQAAQHTVSGVITSSVDNFNARVSVYRLEPDGSQTRLSSAYGRDYSFSLPDGTYLLYGRDDDYGNRAEPEWYPDAPTPQEADAIVVEGADVRVGHMRLEPFKVITGRVVDARGAGLPGISVDAYASGDPSTALRSARTDGAGRFQLEAGRGRWKILFGDRARRHGPLWQAGAASHSAAAVVRVTDSDVNLGTTKLGAGGSIQGTVTSSLPSPAGGVTVRLYDSEGAIVDSATTRANGTYKLPALLAGSYRVEFLASAAYSGKFFGGSTALAGAATVVVGPDQAVGAVDAVLTAATRATPTTPGISGRLVTTGGAPVPNATVVALPSNEPPADPSVNYSTQTTSLADGRFDLSGLSTTQDYRLYIVGNTRPAGVENVLGIAGTYAPGTDYSEATLFTGPEGRVVLDDVVVHQFGGIKGTVLNDVGVGFDGWPEILDSYWTPDVEVYDSAGTRVATSKVHPDGSYRVRSLPAGNYRVNFVDADQDDYVNQWWGGGTSLQTATPVSITAGAMTSGIDAVVHTVRRSVVGRVVDAAGHPVPNARISVFRDQPAHDYDTAYDLGASTTPGGTFDLRVPPGQYRIRLDAEGFVAEIYDNAGHVATATTISVAPGAPPVDLGDIVLDEIVPTLRGRVTDQEGYPIAEAYIFGSDTTTGASFDTVTNADGQWSSPSMPPGRYLVSAGASSARYAQEYYLDAVDSDDATLVQVRDHQWTTHVDFRLSYGDHNPDLGDPLGPVEYYDPTLKPLLNVVRPTITGSRRVGDMLTADVGQWSDPRGLSFTLQWRVDGKVKGTGTTYRVARDDDGKTLVLRVTASRADAAVAASSGAVTLGRLETRVRAHVAKRKLTKRGVTEFRLVIRVESPLALPRGTEIRVARGNQGSRRYTLKNGRVVTTLTVTGQRKQLILVIFAGTDALHPSRARVHVRGLK
ncbi:carboxypeptidase regulatory-like domain-containing protein [Nocardioides sp.]|uniref:carboxypeptidase regulatory-like domain-containing protein n=1 Tax=Nocardioides sp. TaxID=35761 RepID=UPI003568AEF9